MGEVNILKDGTDNPCGHRVLFLDVARVIAAQVVLMAHLRNHMFVDFKILENPPLWFRAIAFLSGFAGTAVVVFFVISGWQVGGPLLRRQLDKLVVANYIIDRLTRFWLVLIPLFFLSTIFKLASTGDFGEDSSLYIALGNLAGLQTLVVPRFGGIYPLWSLANEWFYYFLFPSLLFFYQRRSLLSTSILILILYTYCSVATMNFLLYFFIWLLGALASNSSLEYKVSPAISIFLFFMLIAIARIFRADHIFGVDLIIAVSFLFVVISLKGMRTLGRIIDFSQKYTFSLYVIHVPIIFLLIDIGSSSRFPVVPKSSMDFLIYFLVIFAINVGAWLFYMAFERHYTSVRKFVKTSVLKDCRT